jgi:DNA gyrase subunit A
MAKKDNKQKVFVPLKPSEVGREVREMHMRDYLSDKNLTYMVYTITSRSIPSVVSGVKPGAQRLLESMRATGLTPGSSYAKSAAITSASTGAYHPHGQSGTYDAEVTMAAKYNRLNLVDGEGNFGNYPGEEPAADRYTEARLSPEGYETVREVAEGAVPMRPTYDNKRMEPVYLPAKFPVLLMVGAETAVAEAWSSMIPQHNPREVIEATLAYLDNPDITTDELIEIMPGPDWGTGATIIGDDGGIRQYYETGRGPVTVRGDYHVDGKTIVITSVPPKVKVPTLVNGTSGKKNEDSSRRKSLGLKELALMGVVKGISDVNEYTDESNGFIIEIDVKRGYDPDEVMEEIYRESDMEKTFHTSIVAIDRKFAPRWWNVKEVFGEFIEMRHDVNISKAETRLKQIRTDLTRATALHAISLDKEKAVGIIIDSEDKPAAQAGIADGFDLTEEQSQYIIELPLHRLSKSDSIAIEKRVSELEKAQSENEAIVSSARKRKSIIRKELKDSLKLFKDSKYDRMTKFDYDIQPVKGKHAKQEPDEVRLLNWKVDTESLSVGLNGEKISKGQEVWAVMTDGRVKRFAGGNLPKRISTKPIVPDINDVLSMGLMDPKKQDVIIITAGTNKQNTAKALRLDMTKLNKHGIAHGGVRGINLTEGDTIAGAFVASRDDMILTVSGDSWKVIRVDEIPVKGAGAQGVGIHSLKKGEDGVAIAVCSPNGFVINGKPAKPTSRPATPHRQQLSEPYREMTPEELSESGINAKAGAEE